MIYEFYTPTSLPIEAFSVMGMSAKPNSDNPIGEFGTGLKLAVATVLRLGGTFEVFIDGTEYVFYTKNRDFRGSPHAQVMMRKRKGLLARYSYHELPFTLNYGRNLEAWQVYRELESNTRDEGGESGWYDPDAELEYNRDKGTLIRLSCKGLEEAIENGTVFVKEAPVAWENEFMRVLEGPSNFIYYRGIRVFPLKHPSRYTYDFKPGHMKLTEDRSPTNVWWTMHLIQHSWMTCKVPMEHISKAFKYDTNKDEPLFETHELTFDATSPGISDAFVTVARQLQKKGFVSSKIGTWLGGFTSVSKEKKVKKVSMEFTGDELKLLLDALALKPSQASAALSARIRDKLSTLIDDVPF